MTKTVHVQIKDPENQTQINITELLTFRISFYRRGKRFKFRIGLKITYQHTDYDLPC